MPSSLSNISNATSIPNGCSWIFWSDDSLSLFLCNRTFFSLFDKFSLIILSNANQSFDYLRD
jgi:hypothetical protein